MWLPQGGALKIENSQFTQYSIIMLARSYTQLSERDTQTQTTTFTTFKTYQNQQTPSSSPSLLSTDLSRISCKNLYS